MKLINYLLLMLISAYAFAFPVTDESIVDADQLRVKTSDYVTVKNELELELESIWKHIITPANPAAGFIKIYTKSDDKIYVLNSAGTEKLVGLELTSSNDNRVIKSQGTAGEALEESGVVIDDSNNVSGIANLTVTGTTTIDASFNQPLKAVSGVITSGQIDLATEVTGVLPVSSGGVPTVGADGQILTLVAGTPEFADAPVSTTLDTKGQLQGYSTANANVGPCTDDEILVYDALEATGWKCSAIPQQSPTTTLGDIIVRGASEDERLGVGSEGQILTIVSGEPAYADAPVSTTLTAKGDIQTHNGTSNATFVAGADGEIIVYDSAETTGLNHKAYSPLTTKGDIYVHNGTQETRLPVGENGSFLVADSSKPEGLGFDNYITGALTQIDNWDSYTPTVSGLGTGSTNFLAGRYRRVGDTIHIKGAFRKDASAGSGSSDVEVSLPSGLSIDFTKMPTTGGSSYNYAGSAGRLTGGAFTSAYQVLPTASGTGIRFINVGTTSVLKGADIGAFEEYPFDVTLPITGWSNAVDITAQQELNPDKAGFIYFSAGSITEDDVWKIANGQCLSKTDFPDLLANIGTTYGECDAGTGAGSGINVPNLVSNNRFIRASGGSLALGSTQSNQNKQHRHDTSDHANAKRIGGWSGTSPTTPPNAATVFGTSTTGTVLTYTTYEGGTEARPENIALQAVIRVKNVPKILVAKNTHKLGDCKWSLLSVADFNSAHNGEWIRLDGSSTAGTDLDTAYGITSVPDAISNGSFVRMQGGGSAALRGTQFDATAVNGLGTANDSHAHTQRGIQTYNNANGSYTGRHTGSGTVNVNSSNTTTTDTHSHTVTSSDSETRPYAVTLNFFCMVNK